MIKQTFIAATAIFALTLTAAPVWADEVDCTITPEAAVCLDQSEAGIMPINDTSEATPINDVDDTTPVRDHDYPESSNQTTDGTIEIDEIEVEEETEPALWPMYLSLGVLGLAVLVFIILNLFGGKKRK